MNIHQNEFASIKVLLKQVYSVHTSKVRELENEIKVLKEKLVENVYDCKRCIELEEAFKSCKSAFNEQSKRLETFGNKFSIFNGIEQESENLKISAKILNNEFAVTQTSQSIRENNIICDQNDASAPLEKNNTDNIFKDSPDNQNLLKKVMSYDGLNTNDMCTITFPQNFKNDSSTRKSDFAILAPDSLDIDNESKKGIKRASTESLPEERNNKKLSNNKRSEKCEKIKMPSKSLSIECLKKEENCNNCGVSQSQNCEAVHQIVEKCIICSVGTKYVQDSKGECGMLYSNSLNKNREKYNKGSKSEIESAIMKGSDIALQKTIYTSNVEKNMHNDEFINSTKDMEGKESMIPKNEDLLEIITIGNNKRDSISRNNSCLNSIPHIKKISSPYETSPSLLPKNTNSAQRVIDLKLVKDDDDFIQHASINKQHLSEDSWNICEKRKPERKRPIQKSIKSTSKYKMTLDAPPLNYKKPNYKQVKLTRNFFESNQNKDNSNKIESKPPSSLEQTNTNELPKVSLPTNFLDDFQTSTPYYDAKSLSPIDIDATFIPDNYKCDVTFCGTSAVKRNAVEKSHLRHGNLFASISFPEELKSVSKNENTELKVQAIVANFKSKKKNDLASIEDAEFKENVNSFDRLPVPEEPDYKYKNDVVRKKSERKQLDAFDCKECEKYYSELGLNDKEKKERMKKCSRHRAKFAPPATPDHFWELDFPDTEECKARGYMNETQKVKLNNLCDI